MTTTTAYQVPCPCLVETLPQLARRHGVSVLTVRRWIASGRLQAVRIGGSWRVPMVPTSDANLPPRCTVHQVANSLNVADLTVRRWITAGVLPARKEGRHWVIERNHLEVLLGTGGADRGS